jgi:hypothetical protein
VYCTVPGTKGADIKSGVDSKGNNGVADKTKGGWYCTWYKRGGYV